MSLSLVDALRNTTATRTKPTKISKSVNSSNYVNSEQLIPLGITVPLEKPLAFVDAKPIVEVELVKKDQILLVYSYLSKYPHYKFVKKVHSSWVNKIKFWFLDTKTNITVVASYKDIKEELETSIRTPVRIKEIKSEN